MSTEKRTRAEIADEVTRLREVAARMRLQGAEATEIAAEVDRDPSTVRAWLRADRVPPPCERTREMYRARQIMHDAADMHARGRSIEAIASAFSVDPRVARAAVYLASRESEA